MKEYLTCILILLGMTLTLTADAAGNNPKFWTGFGIDWKPTKNFKLYLEKQLRYEETFTNMESDVSEIGLRFKPAKWLAFRVNYRFTSLEGEKRNRLDGNVYFNLKWSNFKLSNRVRLQKEYIDTHDFSDSQLEFRNRLRLTLCKSKVFQPFAGGEIFIGLGDEGKKQNKLRLTTGLDWKPKKRVTVSLFYHFQRDLAEKTNETFHILGCKFRYSF